MNTQERITALRNSLNLTRKEFAKETGLALKSVQALEKPGSIPGWDIIHKITARFGQDWLTKEFDPALLLSKEPSVSRGKGQESASADPAGEAAQAKAPGQEGPAREEAAQEGASGQESPAYEAVPDHPADICHANLSPAADMVCEPQEPDVALYIQSSGGNTITPSEILERLRAEAPEAASAYIKPEENRIYWVAKDGALSGSLSLWEE